MSAGARVVPDPDTEVLDLLGALLVDLQAVSILKLSHAVVRYTPG